jgi:hypothetical protein
MISIKELSDEILDEYNKNHGSDGRFSSGGSSSDFLSKEETEKINAAVNIRASMESKEKTRIKLVAEMTSSAEGKMVSKWAEYWCADTRSKEALQQVIIRNKLTGSPETHGMTSMQIEALNGFKTHAQKDVRYQKLGYDFEITPQQLKAGAIYQHYNQEMARQHLSFDNKTELEVFRGVHGTYSGKINKLAKDGNVKIQMSSLSSFTSEENTAKKFMNGLYTPPTSDDRSLLRATIKPENVWDSYYSSKALHSGYGGYNEIVTMDGKTNILTVKVEASKFKSMFEQEEN